MTLTPKRRRERCARVRAHLRLKFKTDTDIKSIKTKPSSWRQIVGKGNNILAPKVLRFPSQKKTKKDTLAHTSAPLHADQRTRRGLHSIQIMDSQPLCLLRRFTIEGQTQDGQTRLYIRQRFDSWAILSYFWLFFPTILSAPLIMEQGLAGGIGALIAFAIVAMIGRFSFGLSTRKRSEKLTDLLSTLESIATRSRVTTGTSSGEQTKQEVTEANTTKMQTQPLLNLDALPEQPIAEANQARMPQRNVYGGLD